MLDWLHRFLHGIESLIPSPIRDAIQWSVSAIAGVFGTISLNVADAWHDFTGNLAALAEAVRLFSGHIFEAFTSIFTYWLPKIAYTAWWYVTHPDEFASILLWHLLKWLEHYAWTAARYLGNFVTALIVHNVQRIAALAEEIISAVL